MSEFEKINLMAEDAEDGADEEMSGTRNKVYSIFYDTKDLARMLECSIPTASDIMRRKDFPHTKVGRKYMVSKLAFDKWSMERHD